MGKLTEEIKEEIIKRYQNGETCRQIAKDLGFVHATISSLLKRNKIKVKLYCRLKLPKEFHQEMIQLYQNKDLNTYELGKKYNVSRGAIRTTLLKYGVRMRSKSERMRRFYINENFLDSINTEQKAYILGFFYADGYNNGKNAISLHLHSKDTHLLEDIAKCFSYEGAIRKTNKRDSCILALNSKILSKKLTDLGCPKAKSLILEFPKNDIIPDYLLNHFIRGYMDGDGCIAISKRSNQGNLSFVGSYSFIDGLQDIFIKKFNIKGYKRTKRKIKELVFGGHRQSLILLDWLYKDSTIFLKRKHEKYLKIKNRDL